MSGRDWFNGARRGRGEVVVLIAVVAVLVGFMTPVLRRTYQTALTLRCRQQLAAIFAAVQHYALSYGGYPPCQGAPGVGGGSDWRVRLDPLLEPDERPAGQERSPQWSCPAGGSYVGNAKVFGPPYRTLGSFLLKREIGVIADGEPRCDSDGVGGFERIDWRHRGGANVIFLDGHVEWVPRERAEGLRRHWENPQ